MYNNTFVHVCSEILHFIKNTCTVYMSDILSTSTYCSNNVTINWSVIRVHL